MPKGITSGYFLGAIGAIVGSIVVDPSAAIADRIERGVVVSIEAREAYFDIPRARGLAVGRPLRIKRPVELPHPTTRKMVRDELLVLSGVVTMVGENLSMTEMAADVAPNIRVGDVVEVLVESPDEERPPQPAKVTRELKPVPTVDPQTRRALQTWNSTIARDVGTQIASWRQFLATYPDTPHQAGIVAHLAALEELRSKEPSRLIPEERTVAGLSHNALSTSRENEPIAIALVADDPAQIIAAWLHVRVSGRDTFARQELERDGDRYLRGEIGQDLVTAAGVEYFVEVATRQGDAGPAIGSPKDPIYVSVETVPDGRAFREKQDRSRISTSVDFLDYGTFDRRRDGELHRDRFVVLESDFLFRLRSKATRLWGIRVGLGAINGSGGFADEPIGEDAGFNYGYTEFEFRVLQESSISLRGVAGIGKDGLGFGIESRIRLGAEDGSNLSFAASTLNEVGFLSEVRMQWAAIEKLPLGFSVGVSDRPNRGDLGVRLGTDVGWRATSWFQPTLRFSYQGRSLKHAGIGAGLGMVFDW